MQKRGVPGASTTITELLGSDLHPKPPALGGKGGSGIPNNSPAPRTLQPGGHGLCEAFGSPFYGPDMRRTFKALNMISKFRTLMKHAKSKHAFRGGQGVLTES